MRNHTYHGKETLKQLSLSLIKSLIKQAYKNLQTLFVTRTMYIVFGKILQNWVIVAGKVVE